MKNKAEIEGIGIILREKTIRRLAERKIIAEIKSSKNLRGKDKKRMRHKALIGLAHLRTLDDIDRAKIWAGKQPPLAFHSDLASRKAYPMKLARDYDEIWIGGIPLDHRPKKLIRALPKPYQRGVDEPEPEDVTGNMFDSWITFVEGRERITDDTSNDNDR